jgi:hypothetical protein
MISPECTGTAVTLPSACLRKTWLPLVHNLETGLFKQANQFLSLQSGKAAHIEICWMPTSSSAGLP